MCSSKTQKLFSCSCCTQRSSPLQTQDMSRKLINHVRLSATKCEQRQKWILYQAGSIGRWSQYALIIQVFCLLLRRRSNKALLRLRWRRWTKKRKKIFYFHAFEIKIIDIDERFAMKQREKKMALKWVRNEFVALNTYFHRAPICAGAKHIACDIGQLIDNTY